MCGDSSGLAAEGLLIVCLSLFRISENAVGLQDFLHESSGVDIFMYIGVGMVYLCQGIFAVVISSKVASLDTPKIS